LLPPGTQFDLFRGTAAMKQDIDDMYPTTLTHTIKVGALSKFTTQIFLTKSDCYFYLVCMYYFVVCTVIYIFILRP
jgi:hypothetical protein